jgi:hypothetical protein
MGRKSDRLRPSREMSVGCYKGCCGGQGRKCVRKTVRPENENTLRMSPLRCLGGWLFAGNAPRPARAEDKRTDGKPRGGRRLVAVSGPDWG